MQEVITENSIPVHYQSSIEIVAEPIQKAFKKFEYDLTKIFDTSKQLRELASSEIQFQEPILIINNEPLIFPRTITVIQGATGTHKSRLSEGIASVMLSRFPQSYVGIKRVNLERGEVIILIDTERNLQDQLPYAIQQMKNRAGYEITTDPPMFEYISLLDTPRKERFYAVEAFLEAMQDKYKMPLFVILDVITDCIEDFNRVDSTMNIIDSMNRFINSYDTAFICVIHENPGSEKARGHLGTEIANKASTIIKIGFETISGQLSNDILKMRVLKIRSSKRPEPVFLRFDDDIKSLIAIKSSEISEIKDAGKKANLDELVETMKPLFTEDNPRISKSKLYNIIRNKFVVSDRLQSSV